MPAPLLAKYMRLRRELQGAEVAASHRQRLAQELARIECTLVGMGFTPFLDTLPSAQFDLDAESSAAGRPHRLF
jgi:hypothetical protein